MNAGNFLAQGPLTWLGLLTALAFMLAGCASDDGRSLCEIRHEECKAQCEREFEKDPDGWRYRSCLESCKPKPGAVCY